MNRQEAINLLRFVWGNHECISARDTKRVEAVAAPGESAIQTVARIAEIDLSQVRAFDHNAIRRLCDDAERTK